MRVVSLSSAHSHVSACRVMRAGASPQVALPLLSLFEHGTVRHARGPVETATHQRTHARIPTAWATCAGTPLPHGWYYARPSLQNTWTAPFEERRVARHGLKLRPTPVFLNAILQGITRATLGPCIAVSTPRVGFVRHEPPTKTFSHTMHFLLHSP